MRRIRVLQFVVVIVLLAVCMGVPEAFGAKACCPAAAGGTS